MRFGSVCSGIEAASVALHPFGAEAAWLAEIEAFPAGLLAHHYPTVPNLGDMTQIPAAVLRGDVEAPDVLIGGTPCQAFSVAGMRKGMADPRGLLTIRFVELADAIDHVRTRRGDDKCVVWWENVPGVLSDKENAFGCFLAALVGESDPLVPSGGRWTDAGCVYGPTRAVAWRVLDAQYFGLAQRRRRVFLVASAREGFDPAAVLFERDGVRRDFAPRREAAARAPEGAEAGAGVGGRSRWPAELASTLNAKFGSKLGLEDQHALGGAPLFVPGSPDVMGTLTARMMNALGSRDVEDGAILPCAAPTAVDTYNGSLDDVSPTLCTQGDHASGNAAVLAAVESARGQWREGEVASTLRIGGDPSTVVATAEAGIAHTLRGEGFDASEDGTGRGTPLVPAIAFGCKDGDPAALGVEVSPTLRAMGHSGSHANAGGQVAVAVALRGREGGATAEMGDDCAYTLRASQGGGDQPMAMVPLPFDTTQITSAANRSSPKPGDPCHPLAAGAHAPAIAFAQNQRDEVRVLDVAGTLSAAPGTHQQTFIADDYKNGGYEAADTSRPLTTSADRSRAAPLATEAVTPGMAVRRLTPRECERLQGFPDDYTAIPWRGKDPSECPDGPRYKALGNSMAVPCMRWIGARIIAELYRLGHYEAADEADTIDDDEAAEAA